MKSFGTFLKENPIHETTAIVTVGRFNPPTRGHEVVFNEAARTANSLRGDLRIYTTHTKDAKKNPLTYDQKIGFLESCFPRYKKYITRSEANDPLQVAAELDSKYEHFVLVVGEDRAEELKERLDKYNGDLYNYKSIEVISAGQRNPDNDDIVGVSASKVRSFAATGNFLEFSKSIPRSADAKVISELYTAVRSGMGLQETSPSIELERDEVRENFFSGKIVNEGDSVTTACGKSGTVNRVGANYVIVEDSDGNTSRHWPKDITKN